MNMPMVCTIATPTTNGVLKASRYKSTSAGGIVLVIIMRDKLPDAVAVATNTDAMFDIYAVEQQNNAKKINDFGTNDCKICF